jgi:hypothetical protein
MTTGRINQVTILSVPGIEDAAGATTRRGGRKFQAGDGPRRHVPAGRFPEQRLRRVPTGYPFAPTEFPKRRSATRLIRRTGDFTGCDIGPSGGGYLQPLTSGDG